MAFLHASPTNTTKPICTKMFTASRATSTPTSDDNKHSGTTKMTDSGSDQLSYSAASVKNTHNTDNANTVSAVFPSLSCMNISSVHSVFIVRGSVLLANCSVTEIASPEL